MLRPLPVGASGARGLLLALALLAVGCDFEVDVPIDVPTLDPGLVVYAFPAPDSVWTVHVARTLPLGQANDREAFRVDDATVVVFEDGAAVDTLAFVPEDVDPGDPWAYVSPLSRYRSVRGGAPTLGRAYRLEVTAPDLPLASAEIAFPDPPEATVVADEWIRYDPDGLSERRVEVALNDPDGRDVYEMAVVSRQPAPDGSGGTYTNVIRFGSLSPSFRQDYETLDIDVAIEPDATYWNGAVFDDDLFSGRRQTFELTFEMGPFAFDPSMGIDYSVLIVRVSEAFAEHEVRRAQQSLNADNPFAEPSPLYSNVQGGHGVVGPITPLRLLLGDLPPPGASGVMVR